MRRTLILAATVWAVADAASADVMSDLAQSGNCWRRTYDASHLRNHPRQRVTQFSIGPGDLQRVPAARNPAEVDVGFIFRVRGSGEEYGGMAVCRRSGAGADCGVEGDGGRFRLEPRAGGVLRLSVVGGRLAAEGETGFTELTGAEDRVFDLPRVAAGACEVETAASE